MEVKIGVQDTARELSLTSAQSSEEVAQAVADAIANGGLLKLTDEKGRLVIVPVEKLGYVDIGEPSSRKVGFGA